MHRPSVARLTVCLRAFRSILTSSRTSWTGAPPAATPRQRHAGKRTGRAFYAASSTAIRPEPPLQRLSRTRTRARRITTSCVACPGRGMRIALRASATTGSTMWREAAISQEGSPHRSASPAASRSKLSRSEESESRPTSPTWALRAYPTPRSIIWSLMRTSSHV